MGKNLFDFGEEKLEDKTAEKFDKVPPKAKENIEQLHKKYKDFSSEDLFRELKKQQQMGNLDRNKLNQIMNSVGPFLDESQRKLLMETINKLNDN